MMSPLVPEELRKDCSLATVLRHGSVPLVWTTRDRRQTLEVFVSLYRYGLKRWSGTDRVWYGIGWTVTGGLQIIRRVAGGTLLTGTRLSNVVTNLAG